MSGFLEFVMVMGVVAAQAVGADVTENSVRQYEDKVRELEQRGGSYDADLPETLVGLGLARMALADYAGAERALRRALHTTRVTHGLYSVEQLPIVERLIEVNSRTRDYQDLNQNYHFLFWLTKRIYGTDDPKLLPELDRMGRWHLAAYLAGADNTPMSHLFAALDLYEQAIEIIETQYGTDDPALVNALYATVVTRYQIASEVSRIEFEGDVLAADADSLDSRASRVYRDGFFRERLMMECFGHGKDAMQRIAAIHEGNKALPLESQAMALVHLGDWNVLFQKWGAAHDAYAEAYALLRQDGRTQEEIDGMFEHPRVLPAIGLPQEKLREFLHAGVETEPEPEPAEASAEAVDDWDSEEVLAFTEPEEVKPEPVNFVLLSFDVSNTGKPRNISVVESNIEDKRVWRKARKSMAARRFRPRIVNGEAVDAEGVNLRMVFRD